MRRDARSRPAHTTPPTSFSHLSHTDRTAREQGQYLDLAKLFAQAVRFYPFEESAPGSGDWYELENLEELEELMPTELEKEKTLTLPDGNTVELSAIGATLYASKMSTLIHVRNQFNKQLEDRLRTSTKPGGPRVQGPARRTELETLFGAISAAELKKGVRALSLPEGTKAEMMTTLLDRFAPKRKRKRTAAEMAADLA